jgi:hypothetical protein
MSGGEAAKWRLWRQRGQLSVFERPTVAATNGFDQDGPEFVWGLITAR